MLIDYVMSLTLPYDKTQHRFIKLRKRYHIESNIFVDVSYGSPIHSINPFNAKELGVRGQRQRDKERLKGRGEFAKKQRQQDQTAKLRAAMAECHFLPQGRQPSLQHIVNRK